MDARSVRAPLIGRVKRRPSLRDSRSPNRTASRSPRPLPVSESAGERASIHMDQLRHGRSLTHAHTHTVHIHSTLTEKMMLMRRNKHPTYRYEYC
ncbi:unnamed protein product [Danaus chrysippus]|uniref:(African queen) hypothetical protein n=1 Tax=Danaus chrysippus TaxID=151541 RepID=A0A8J2MFI8_9NEOP|nr:unnamed protein product [Danaus chrysippus]